MKKKMDPKFEAALRRCGVESETIALLIGSDVLRAEIALKCTSSEFKEAGIKSLGQRAAVRQAAEEVARESEAEEGGDALDQAIAAFNRDPGDPSAKVLAALDLAVEGRGCIIRDGLMISAKETRACYVYMRDNMMMMLPSGFFGDHEVCKVAELAKKERKVTARRDPVRPHILLDPAGRSTDPLRIPWGKVIELDRAFHVRWGVLHGKLQPDNVVDICRGFSRAELAWPYDEVHAGAQKLRERAKDPADKEARAEVEQIEESLVVRAPAPGLAGGGIQAAQPRGPALAVREPEVYRDSGTLRSYEAPQRPPVVCVLCAEEDAGALHRFRKHMPRQSLVLAWDNVACGANTAAEMRSYLDQAQVVVVLLSADFLASSSHQHQLALARAMGKRVIPVLVRACLYAEAIGGALALHGRQAKTDEDFVELIQGILPLLR